MSQIVDIARSYLGTRFLHQGRSREGIDCVGLIAVVMKELGYEVIDVEGYNRSPDPMQLIKTLRLNVERIDAQDAQVGDIYLMKLGGDPRPRHVSIRASDETDVARSIEPTLIHALSKPYAGYVLEQPVSLYRHNIVGAFRIR